MECYTKVENNVLEQLAKTDLSPAQFRLVMVICRLTYGFHREVAQISTSTFQNRTGLDPRNIRRKLKELVDRRIVYQIVEGTKTRIIGMNRRFIEWLDEQTATGHAALSDAGQSPLSGEGEAAPSAPGQAPPTIKKEIKKEIKKNNKQAAAGETAPTLADLADELECYFCAKKGKLPPGSLADMESMKRVIGQGIPAAFIKGVIDKAFLDFHPQFVGDSIHTFRYIESIAVKSWHIHLEKHKPAEGGQRFAEHGRSDETTTGTGSVFPTGSRWEREAIAESL